MEETHSEDLQAALAANQHNLEIPGNLQAALAANRHNLEILAQEVQILRTLLLASGALPDPESPNVPPQTLDAQTAHKADKLK